MSYILDWGFRLFFLLGSLGGIAAVLYWALVLKGIASLPKTMPAAEWHAHEMVFGFGGAALAGFLLTAVPSRTDTAQVRQGRLALLVGLWLAARLSVGLIDYLPVTLVMVINMAFSLGLAMSVISPLWRDADKRHVVFIFVIFLFFLAQLATYLGWLGFGEEWQLSRRAIYGGVYALVYEIIVTSTRISMVVVRLALDEQKDTTSTFRPLPVRRNMAAATFLLFAGFDLILTDNPVLGWVALAAGASQMDRLTDFHLGRVWQKPYVLLVYIANLWIGLGCIAMGVNALVDLGSASDLLHLFAMGAMGTAILAVFTIAGLRHSDLALVVPRQVMLALGLLVAGCVFRVSPALSWEMLSYSASLDKVYKCFENSPLRISFPLARRRPLI